MTAATKNAPGERSDAHAGARTPSLDRKAGTVDPIMHHKIMRRAQRHADQARTAAASAAFADLRRRVDTAEIVSHATHDWVASWIPAGFPPAQAERITPHAPDGHPESLTAELPEDQEIALAALSNDLWPHDEYLGITAWDEQR